MDIFVRHPDQLAAQLKSLRRLRGMSQTELGKQIGVGQARVAEIEANPGAVSFDQLLRIFQVLDAEVLLRATEARAASKTPLPLRRHAVDPAPAPQRQSPDSHGDAVITALARKLGTTVDKLRSLVDAPPASAALPAREPTPAADEAPPGPLRLTRHRGSW